MNPRWNVRLSLIVPMVLTAMMVLAAPGAFAQEEPTPVPEPAEEAPVAAAAPEVPEAAAEPTAAAAPAAAPVEETEAPVAEIPIIYRKQTLIKIDGKAEANGVVELVVQPQGGDPVKVRVNVLAKSKPKEITSDVLKELDFAIDDRYKVSRSGDQKITVKALKKNPPIAITVKTQSLSGVSLTVANG